MTQLLGESRHYDTSYQFFKVLVCLVGLMADPALVSHGWPFVPLISEDIKNKTGMDRFQDCCKA
jgi:hypothetical protein